MIVLILIFILLIVGFGGYRLGPGWGYNMGGGLGLVILLIIVWLLLGHGALQCTWGRIRSVRVLSCPRTSPNRSLGPSCGCICTRWSMACGLRR
jgi:hypothetical protein